MCGLAGFFTKKLSSCDEGADIVRKMIDTLKHRGPDDSGIWKDHSTGIFLGHRRLSILDLSEAGHQPMISKSGRYVIAFNGEIYNFKFIKNQVEKFVKLDWAGNSDTEILIEAIELWGLQETLVKAVGVFAIALWDNEKKCLHLARDRVGEKPLYYGLFGNSVIFGSELKALAAHPEFRGKISLNALNLFLRFGFISAPHSIYEDIFKVKPGTVVTFTEGLSPTESRFWNSDDIPSVEAENLKYFNDSAALDGLEQRLSDAISLQSVADVPIGAFLSGGVDSTSVVALMQKVAISPVKTFTIGFQDKRFNEAESAKKIAAHLGTDHTEVFATSIDALNIIPDISDIYDEPFADPSQIPTVLISRITKEFVTVALSGDGGDELFAGYNRYSWTNSIMKSTGYIPHSIRKAVGRGMKKIPDSILMATHPILRKRLPSHITRTELRQKVDKFSDLIGYDTDFDLYINLQSNWLFAPTKIDAYNLYSEYQSHWEKIPNLYSRMMSFDMKTYLPDDILVKVDRASMSVGLEARLPFLDHRVIEYAQALPMSLKVRDGQSKWLLRQVLYKYIPRDLIEKPKMGFSAPLADWLRGPLKDWADDLLSESKLGDSEFFDYDLIRAKWFAHRSGSQDNAFALWSVLMFQLWYYSNHIQWNRKA